MSENFLALGSCVEAYNPPLLTHSTDHVVRGTESPAQILCPITTAGSGIRRKVCLFDYKDAGAISAICDKAYVSCMWQRVYEGCVRAGGRAGVCACVRACLQGVAVLLVPFLSLSQHACPKLRTVRHAAVWGLVSLIFNMYT